MTITQQDHTVINNLVEKWADSKGNLIMILHELQNHFNYVPRDVTFILAEKLKIPLARIYEVITFYNYFKLEEPGKHTISVCTGTACYLKGAQKLIEEFYTLLGIKDGETTANRLFHLQSVRCLGCCGLAPVLMIDKKVYGKVKKEDLTSILAEYIK